MKNLIDQLINPSKEYRPVPLWSWNDRLDRKIMRWQIEEMKKAGLGGFFMHARGGLQTEYLSKEWMDSIETGIEEGSKNGLDAWIYDECGWPSGFAAGLVPALGEEFHVRWLEFKEVKTKPVNSNNLLGFYKLDAKSKKITSIAGMEVCDNLEGEDKLYVVRHNSSPYYIDILNKDVVKVFLNITHERYYQLFGDKFGGKMPGFFTDEPQYCRDSIPWSNILPQHFKDAYGYDLLQKLPALFIECEGYEKVRYEFWALVSELFTTSYGKQIYDWCEEHNCKFTGHILGEGCLYSQMRGNAGVMPFYQYMHIPGIDWLGRKIGNPVILKQVSSVANQLGKKFVMCETFALSGWDVSFEELKWLVEWQYVNGVSMICQHLESYSLRGMRKRDYPPSMFYQQSWWEEYRVFNDYLSRIGLLLTSGCEAVDVLLVHPMKSAWIAYNGSNNEQLQKLDSDFDIITSALADFHIPHHYGDESIIREYGKIKGSSFVIGACAYKIIILPAMVTIDQQTVMLLNQFLNNGGYVISTGNLPTLINGTESQRLGLLLQKVISYEVYGERLYSLIKDKSENTLSIADKTGELNSIHYMQRELETASIIFMVNHNQSKTFNATVTIKRTGEVVEYNTQNNEVRTIDYTSGNGTTSFTLEFLPMQSHVIILNKSGISLKKLKKAEKIEINIGNQWQVEKMDLNSLTLDYCNYSINGSEWEAQTPVIDLMDILLKQQKNCDIALRFNFQIEADLSKIDEMFLAVEKADEFDMFVNENRIIYKDIGWWKDISIKKVDIRRFLKAGNNEIVFKRRFYQSQKVYDVLFGENVLESETNKLTFDTELESIYVVGSFGVISKSDFSYGDRKAVYTEGPFAITNRPYGVNSGSLTEQGFCFFAGKLSLSQIFGVNREENQRVILNLGNPIAALSKVFINGNLVKVLPWAPYMVDITDFVLEDNNKLIVELFASNRNLFGPHHNRLGESHSVGPSTFKRISGWEEKEGYDIEPNTYMWSDNYCFVKFGLED